MRLIALLLAVMMMTGAATPAVGAATDAITAVDDAQDLDAPILPVATPLPAPECREQARVVLPSRDRGRMHAVHVFRPPRALA